jgi:hypothetical protein
MKLTYKCLDYFDFTLFHVLEIIISLKFQFSMPSYSLFFVSFASIGWSARERVVRGCLTAGIKWTCSEIHNNPKKNDTIVLLLFLGHHKNKNFILDHLM